MITLWLAQTRHGAEAHSGSLNHIVETGGATKGALFHPSRPSNTLATPCWTS